MNGRIWMTLGCLMIMGMMIFQAEADDALVSAVNARTLESGDNLIHGFTYYNGYLWASTRTSPCRILRIDTETLNYDRIILSSGLSGGEDLLEAGGYIWVILSTYPSRIVRVDPDTMKWEIAVAFQSGELSDGGSLEYAYGYLWAGGSPGKIARIDLSDLSYQVYDYSDAVGGFQFHAMTSGGGYIWGSSHSYRDSWFWGREYIGHTIVRIDPDNPQEYSSLYLPGTHMSDDIAYAGGCLYTGSEESPSHTYRVNDDLTYTSARCGDTICYGLFAQQDRIWGAYVGNPGRIAVFDLDLNLEASYLLPSGCRDANEMAFDPSGNLYYVTCWESPAKVVKLERKEMRYLISGIPQESRGGVIIPIEVFPEGKGEAIPIYVPPVIDGSNMVRDDDGWSTVKEIEKSDLDFQWEKLAADFTFQGADTPAGAGLSAIAGLIESLHGSISVYQCRIRIQENDNGDMRAIVQIGDPDSRTFMRQYAGKTWMPFSESFWLIQAAFSGQVCGAFGLEPDDFPDKYYTMKLDLDSSHGDDPYIGYLWVAGEDRIIMTPAVYPKDRLEILRVRQIVVPYKVETVMELAGDTLTSLMEGPVEPGLIQMLSPSISGSAIVVQGRSPIEVRIYDSQRRVTGVVDGEVRTEIPASLYDSEHKIALVFLPDGAYTLDVAGTGSGEYGLDAALVRGQENTSFAANHIPVSESSLHQYAIDWSALSEGKEGVTVSMDDDGDGVFEQTVMAGSEYTPTATGVTPQGKYPTTWAGVRRTAVFQNYPNPFNPDTWIPYALAEGSQVTISIYSVTGQLVRMLDLGEKPAGAYLTKESAAHWDGRDNAGELMASGIYFYSLDAGDFHQTRKMTVLH